MKIKYRLLQLTVLFIMAAFVAVHAADVSKDDILNAARKWIVDNAIFQSEQPDAIPATAVRLTDGDGQALPLWRVDLSPSGYLVMSSDDTLPPVVAFDTKAVFETSYGHPLPSMLTRQGEIFQAELGRPKTRGNEMSEENQSRWNVLLNRTRAASVTPSTIVRSPMLATEWSQDAPFNYFCPSGDSYFERAVTGCVSLAISQMLKYHEWPVAGSGSKSYTDNEGDVQGTLKADYSVPYDWDAMADSYSWKEERDYGAAELAVARLTMEMGVLAEADYGIDGTAAYSHNLHTLLAQYLGYSSSAVYGDTRSGYIGYVAQSTLYSRIRSDMTAGRPAFVSYEGHTFIADGLGTMGSQDYYHFNYGWGGYQNGWYLLTDGYENTVIIGATTNIQPLPVAVFKPISCEQTSSFTLSWDFPKRLTAEAFRLTKTTGTRASTVISSSISGTSRSYTLTGQSGTATYTLEAKVGGSWQAVSEGITVTVKTAPAAMLSLSVDGDLKSIAGKQATTTITANNSLTSLTITSNRPDMLPASGISVTGSGTSRTVRLTPASGTIGNVLLYITATDVAGNTIRQTVPLAVMQDEVLTWHTTKAEAMAAATENGKLVLMVAGRNTCPNTNYFRNTVCETSDIKATLLADYELWYCIVDSSSEYSQYASGLGSTLPWIAIIDPANQSKRLRGHGGYMSIADARVFLNPYAPYFSLDNSEIYVIGTTQTLELSVLKSGAEIRYRLDSSIPTISDTLYTSAISLTSTTTVSARAFLNGEPVSDTVTKTYTFLEQVATPVLSKGSRDYFEGSCVLTVSCATPGATVRYTTDLYYPTESSSVFPAGGLTITEDTIVLVRAFKDGMKQSEWAVSELYAVTRLTVADAIVTGTDVTMYSTDTPWFLQTTTYNSSPSAMQSGTIGNSENSALVAKVNGPGTLTFYWRASSESYYDRLSFIKDGETQTYISGATSWAQKSYTVTGSGEHWFAWDYSKDSSDSANNDCAWVDDIVWTPVPPDKTLVSIAISGNSAIATASTAAYTCTASWSDGTTSTVTSDATWSLSSTTYASVSTAGVVTNKNTTTTDQTVTLNASYTANGVTKTASKSGITLSKKVLTGIAISGNASIATASTATYTCTATWSYGSNTTVTPTWSLSSTTYASVSTAGVVTNKNTTTTDQTVTLNASYSVNGVTKTASKSGITLEKKVLTGIAISGNATIATASTATYTCTATWSYGSNTTVTPTWSLSSTTYASVSTAGVVTNKNTTTTDQTVTLNASYTINGVTKTVSKSITLSKKVLTGITISGDATIATGSTETYTCTATWSYGSTTTVTPTWTITPPPYASVSTGGVVTNQNTTTTEQTVTLTASYTINGVTKTATKTITLEAGGELDTQTLTLEAGWNWVSFNVLPESHKVGDVLGTAGFTVNDIIQTNGGVSRFTGASWMPGSFTVEYGKLYQIYVTNAVTVEIQGEASGLSSVPLVAGWNWIANPTGQTAALSELTHGGSWTAGDRIQTAGGGVTYTGSKWIPANGISLEPGKGYQIYTANAGTLSFPVPVVEDETLYAVVDLSGGPNAESYPVRYSSIGPDLSDDTYRTTELWLRKIPAGTCIMGCDSTEIGYNGSEFAKHEVTLTQDYYIGVFECTQKQWELVMGSNPSAQKGETRPVEQTSYGMIRGSSPAAGGGWPIHGHVVDSLSFLGKMQQKTGLVFDLPTEAEWEYACRAGTTTSLNSGKDLSHADEDENMDELGRYSFNRNDGNGGYTQHTAVGSYQPNALGLYDMHGNIYEWCLDWYQAGDEVVFSESIVDPLGPVSGSYRVMRGGSWVWHARNCRSANRDGSHSPDECRSYAGFRVVCHPNREWYAVVDLSGGPDAESYPVRYTSVAPNLEDDTCRTTELWLRQIPAGTFVMGAPSNELGLNNGEMTQHTVTLTQDYYIGVFECTQRQWELVMGTRPSYFNNVSYYSTRPVECVSYSSVRGTGAQSGAGWPSYGHAVDSSSFMGRLQEKTGLAFDLPTEAQWEYACRAGTTTAINTGKNLTSVDSDDGVSEVARYMYNGGSGYSQNCSSANGTAKVGSYLPNAWGLYDMHGNVNEWCLDWWGANTSSTAAVTDPSGPSTGGYHVLRGGHWGCYARFCRSGYRGNYSPTSINNDLGFRIAIQPKKDLYAVVDLSGGPKASSYPVRYTSKGPDLSNDTCRTTELWLRQIPAGTFIMGSPNGEMGRWDGLDMKQHQVTLTQSFYVGVFEVTQKQWSLVKGDNPSQYLGDCRPVERLSYDDIRGTSPTGGAGWPVYGHAVDNNSFLGLLRQKTGLLFDLPTDAQWEYACRAGTSTALNSGKNLTNWAQCPNLAEVGRYYYNRSDGIGGYTNTHTKVGSYLPNAWGLYDMHGNVFEWCLDWWGADANSTQAVTDPVGPESGENRLLRGGDWGYESQGCRSGYRANNRDPYIYYRSGFRVVFLPEAASE